MVQHRACTDRYGRFIIIVATFCLGALIAAIAAAEDARSHVLRNIYTGPLAGVGLAGFGFGALIEGSTFRASSLLLGAAIFTGPWLVSFLISPASIGFGDVKYGAALGIYLGWLGPDTALVGLILACAVGGLIALVVVFRRRSAEPFPFGPALLAGAALAVAAELLPATT